MRYLNILLVFILFIVIYIHMLVLKESEKGEVKKIRNQEKENIVFLKTHKCASTSVQNILLRYGYLKNLSFVLPSTANYIGHPETFHSDMIPFDLIPVKRKFNILTHHTRFNYNEIKKVMNDDAVYVTILRHPVDVFESLYSYYNLGARYNSSIHNFLKRPSKYINRQQRFRSRIGVNQMSFDLGFEENGFKNTQNIFDFIREIESKFDLIMISEYFEASLVLMADILNWPLSNIQYLPQNVRTKDKITKLSSKERETAMKINGADAFLYNFFLKKFQEKIIKYGEEKLLDDVDKLLELNNILTIRCVENESTYGYKNTINYFVRNKSDWFCTYLCKNELEFTEEIRNFQRKRLGTLRKLQTFLKTDIN